ncbi:LuxR C-terminal-related transcriptional regulator [soil metagenome]
MEPSLVATKLQIPPQPRRCLPRAKLVEGLEQGIPHYRMTLLSAPAGYGKTSLVSQWAHESQYQVAWLSVESGDNDVERFFRYVFRAWEEVQPGIQDSQLGLLLGSMAPDSEAVLSSFVNLANDLTEHTVFVLDDYHLIDEPEIHRALTYLIDHFPPRVHVVISGRGEPDLPLARYRARRQLLELRVDDLRFSDEEALTFLRQHMGLELDHDQAQLLQSQIEGWVAGLQLAAMTRRQESRTASDPLVSGRHRYIADYLTEDVFARQSDRIQRFLLHTSILDRLCDSLCDAVTGDADGQVMLESLERNGLFLVPLDSSRHWFRYHRLFADFLLETLNRRSPDEVEELHRRAARWFLANDLTEQAFSHAIEARDAEIVMDIVEQDYYARLLGGEMFVARRWIASMPPSWFDQYPSLAIARAGLILMTEGLDAGAKYLDVVEDRLRQEDRDDISEHLARVSAVRCFIACYSNDLEAAKRYADQAIDDLPEGDQNLRPGIFGALGDTYRRNGLWDDAQRAYRQLLDFRHTPSFRVDSAHVYGALADLELRQGRLRDAAAYWNRALNVLEERHNWGRIPLPVIGWVHVRTGELYYERNDLSSAWDHTSRGLERAELGGDVTAMLAGYLVAGRLKLTEGSVEAALDFLERARPLAVDSPNPEWLSRFERLQLEVWLAQDHLRTAVHWSEEVLEDGALLRRPEGEPARLALARVLLVRGDPSSRERAAELIERMHRSAERDGRMGVQIEALALQAIVWWMRGDRAEAMVALERGLSLAEPEGYVRLFADLGPSMVQLLQEARSRDLLPEYVGQLLAACDHAGATGHDSLSEPLTDREHEVLGMISAGLTNAEIAGKLFISAETVKKHAGNIYGKLGVRTRTEASSKARELDLLR